MEAQSTPKPGQSLQALKARVVESITQRKALLARELREMQLRLTMEAPGDIESQQAREKLMEEFKMKMTAFKSQAVDIYRFNAMSDQEFAAWCEDNCPKSAFLSPSVHTYSPIVAL